jgi:chromosome segregation protein
MKLTSLEIHGFKSFADRTKLQFDQGITGIVGPNGCGKSNVIDAIRWVLGEQKTRNLRSDKMENVIFNGTDKRKRAGLAEVTMTLDNDRNVLPEHYSTISITRRLHRDGESEYLLNSVPCRLKDITSLLLDTGIGSDSYSIIELGMVEDLLTDKNNARRELFEEAAGISKYKVRKKETLHKLDETQTSLTRVEDLLAEIEKNLKLLERQAKRAEQYLHVKADYKLASSRMALVKTQALAANHQLQLSLEEQVSDQITQLSATLAQGEAGTEQLHLRVAEVEARLQHAQGELDAHRQIISQLESAHGLRNERIRYLLQRQEQLNTLLAEGQLQRTQLADARTRTDAELLAAQAELEAHAARAEAAQVALDEARQAQQAVAEQVRLAAEALRQLEQQQQTAHREGERRQGQRQSLEAELHRGQAERDTRAQERQQQAEKLNTLKQQAHALETDVETLARGKATYEATLKGHQESLDALRESAYQVQRTLDIRRQEFTMTQSLVDSLEGFSESVKFLKKAQGWAREPLLLGDCFTCPENYKKALEAVLEPYLNYLVVETRAEAMAGMRLLREAGRGRANFFILAEVREIVTSRSGANVGPYNGSFELLSLVESDAYLKPLAHYLVGNVCVVKDGYSFEAGLPDGLVVVETSGTLLTKRATLVGGSLGLFEGTRIGRAQNLEKLAPEIAQLETELTQQQQAYADLARQIQELQKTNPAQRLEQQQRELQLMQRQVSMLQVREDEFKQFEARNLTRRQDIEAEIARLDALTAEAAPAALALQTQIDEALLGVQAAQRNQEATAQALALKQDAHNRENIAGVEARNLVASLEKDLRRQAEQTEQIIQAEATRTAELATVATDLEELTIANAGFDEQIVALYATRDALLAALNAEHEGVAALRLQLTEQDSALKQIRRERDERQQQLAQLKDQGTEIRIQENAMRERMEVEFGISIGSLNPEVLFDQPLSEIPLEPLEAEVMRLRDQIQRFGEVNPTAIEAYEEVKQRWDFIQAQRTDLFEARENLLSTIEEMDTTAKAKFMDAFERIRDNFGRVFRTLFTEHDTCDLTLVNPDNVLESPIEIMARPKGKRPLTINQLSGGEKTLTATSLLFAIYLLKPAPFCIFDEVDAPLDDANIDKFTNIIGEFSGQSQFIVVTHNKRTMVKTNVMYGVTMEETGISRVLPVSIEALNLN